MSGIDEIKQDMDRNIDLEEKYQLTTGTHELKIDLTSKKVEMFESNDLKLKYHRFNIIGHPTKKWISMSNYLYGEFLKAIRQNEMVVSERTPIVDTKITITRIQEKMKYQIYVIGLKEKGDVNATE
jgi:hypothetical protein